MIRDLIAIDFETANRHLADEEACAAIALYIL